MARYSFPFQSTTRNHHAWSRSLIADALSVPVSWVLLAELCTLAFLAHKALGVDFYTWGHTDEWLDEHLQQGALLDWTLGAWPANRSSQSITWSGGGGSRRTWSWSEATTLLITSPMHTGLTSGSVDGVVGRLRHKCFWRGSRRNPRNGATYKPLGLGQSHCQGPHYGPGGRAPFVGICGAVRMEELMQSLGEADPLGLREQLLLMYERPGFVPRCNWKNACQKLPAGSTVHELFCFQTPADSATEVQVRKRPSFSGNLLEEQAALQESNYMLDQQLARKAGKGKTRHVRFALPFHNLMQKVAGDSSCGQSKP